MKTNFYKGSFGDLINPMLAAAAFNFKKWIRLALIFIGFFKNLVFLTFLNFNILSLSTSIDIDQLYLDFEIIGFSGFFNQDLTKGIVGFNNFRDI